MTVAHDVVQSFMSQSISNGFVIMSRIESDGWRLSVWWLTRLHVNNAVIQLLYLSLLL